MRSARVRKLEERGGRFSTYEDRLRAMQDEQGGRSTDWLKPAPPGYAEALAALAEGSAR